MLLVVVYHLPLERPWLPGGFIGVDVFFVLSGALITRLLLAEEGRTRTIALGMFYWRRLRRLYPAMILMIVATVVASAFVFPRDVLPGTLRDAGWCAVYLGTIPALAGKVRFFGHAWSLSLEEIFYLVWPAAMLALRSRRARILFAVLVVVACEARLLELWFGEGVPSRRVWVAIDTRAGVIALGCLIGLAGSLDRIRRALLFAAPAAAVGLLALARFGDRTQTWYAVWGYPASALLASVVVARLFAAPSFVLSRAPLVWLGKLSYAMYLWHVPLITIGDELRWPIPLSIAIAFALAWLSHRFVETRLRASSGSELARGVLQESR
jgi:peptidoglycan/LPS O-acetylase OafA/YrhL